MDTEMILIIIMGAILLLWVIFCGCFTVRRIFGAASRSGFKAHIKCESCGTEFDVSAKEALRISMTKTKSTTRTRVQGAALVNRPVYSSYAKKFYCKNCGNKTFGQVLNLEEIHDSFKPPVTREVLKGFAMMIVGGLAVIIIMQIPMSIARMEKEKEIEQMKQQQLEQIREQYWNR